MINIISFNSALAKNFRDLNLLWLEEFFKVEPKDKLLLEDCESEIIDKGGFIFFALIDEIVVGCFALIKVSETVFELGKMAVDPTYQGNNIGQQLLVYALNFCKKMKYEKLLLYSHTKLKAAIHIYRKYGFIEVPLEAETPYNRSNIKMVLSFN
jgi:N-acetylglutamate synthase-like GNAT family acetyltransferase